MNFLTYTSPQEFLQKYGDSLYENESTFNLLLGLVERAVVKGRPEKMFFHAVEEDGRPLAVVLKSNIPNLVLGQAKARALPVIASEFFSRYEDLQFLVGATPEIDELAKEFGKLSGKGPRVVFNQMIYQATQVEAPPQTEGRLEIPKPEEFELLAKWQKEFILEAVPQEPFTEDGLRKSVELRVQERRLYVWRLNDKPVSMVGSPRETQNGATIGPVFTPKELRGKGYASNATAALAKLLLESGKRYISLYTDLANPTSNSIYQKIGFRPIQGSRQYALA